VKEASADSEFSSFAIRSLAATSKKLTSYSHSISPDMARLLLVISPEASLEA
jgi:hypothetical protein